jgi:hypothetical protein
MLRTNASPGSRSIDGQGARIWFFSKTKSQKNTKKWNHEKHELHERKKQGFF